MHSLEIVAKRLYQYQIRMQLWVTVICTVYMLHGLYFTCIKEMFQKFKCTCTSILELLKTSMFNDKQTGFYVVQSNHFYGNSADIFENDGLHIHVQTLLQVFPRLQKYQQKIRKRLVLSFLIFVFLYVSKQVFHCLCKLVPSNTMCTEQLCVQLLELLDTVKCCQENSRYHWNFNHLVECYDFQILTICHAVCSICVTLLWIIQE